MADWINETGLTVAQVRRMLDVNRSTLHRYLTNQRVPEPRTLQKIIVISGGRVQLVDFLESAPPLCAEVVPRTDGRSRWVFPWTGDGEREEPTSSRLSPNLLRAIRALDGRAWFTPGGRFLLDGRISDPRRVVEAANKRLERSGETPIPYPFVSPIDGSGA